MNLEFVVSYLVLPLLCGGMILGFIRLLAGPTLPDRIIAFEVISANAAGIIVAYSIASDHSVLLDVASVWAIISFLSVIAFAYYIEKWRGVP